MIRLATVFSGIGAVEEAMKKQKIDYKLVFACDNGERELKETKEEIQEKIKKLSYDESKEYIDKLYLDTGKPNYMEESYMANYDIDKRDFHQDIRFIDGNHYKNKVDLLVGGSPCQSFSIIGKRGGFNDTRGTLFYEYARLIKDCEPKVFIFENVRGILNHDKGKTWETIQNVFKELKYRIFINDDPILNARDYGIPQNRPRLFVIGIREDIKLDRDFKFPKKEKLTTTMFDYLEEVVDAKYYLGQKGFEFVTNPKYRNRARVNENIIMCEKANQQFNWNGDFVFEEYDKNRHNEEIMKRAYLSKWNEKTGVIRKLTPRECLRLMGFSDNFKIVVPDVQMYRQAGNSIVVNIFERVLKEFQSLNLFDDKTGKNKQLSLFEKWEIDDRILDSLSKEEKVLRVGTLFSGIGAPEQALKRLGINYKIVFACDNGDIEIEYNSEDEMKKIRSMKTKQEKKEYVDSLYSSKSKKHNYVKESYMANYDISEDDFHLDINLLDGTDYKNQVDLLIGGSPCQSFSTVGFQGGLEDTRGTLFYEYARIIKETNPKVFIYENVRGLTTHDKGKTWAIMQEAYKELGYNIYQDILNAEDYGIPQIRRRLFVVGFRKNIKLKKEFEFPKKQKLEFYLPDLLLSKVKEGNFISKDGKIQLIDEPGVIDQKYILSPLLKKYVMCTGTKTFKTSLEIDRKIARTVLSTMGNRHRAGVDNYMTDLGEVRMLTEREAHRLMGFPDDYKIVVSRAQAYKQAGNSIVVDVMLAVLNEIINTGVFEES